MSKLIVTKKISLSHCPEIMQLAEEGEELKDLISPENELEEMKDSNLSIVD